MCSIWAPALAMMVVSEMGEQWSPQTAPAQQAEMPMIISLLSAGKMAVTMGIRIAEGAPAGAGGEGQNAGHTRR
jgi:hypothetical protein